VDSFHELTDIEYKVRLPSLNRINGWTTAVFQVLLIAHSHSAMGDQQWMICRLVHLFQFGAWFAHWESLLFMFLTFLFLFPFYLSTCVYHYTK